MALDGAPVVVVCHSLSCLLWLRAAAALPRVARLLLVSPPVDEAVPVQAADFRAGAFDVAAVRASVREELTVVGSDNDPYNPAGVRRTHGDPLGVRTVVVPGGGHLTPDDGYGRWPLVEEWCMAS